MAITVTVENIKKRCPELRATNTTIQDLISVMDCLMDTCLEASYPNCPAQAKLIKTLTICHFALSSTESGQLTSRRWPNGASESYSAWASGQGLQATRFGTMILSLDTASCVKSIFPDRRRRLVAAVGTSGSRSTPYSRRDRENQQ